MYNRDYVECVSTEHNPALCAAFSVMIIFNRKRSQKMAFRKRRRLYGKKPRSYKAFYGRRRRKLYGTRLLSRRGGFMRP